MIMKYEINIDNKAIENNFNRITNQIFKLLPNREEGGEWEAPLQNLIIEVSGLASLLFDQTDLLRLLIKLEGLKTLTKAEDFLIFRTTIFECLSLMNKIRICLV